MPRREITPVDCPDIKSKKVKQEYGRVGLHAAMICHYVNANLQGMSPLKMGVKRDIPPCAFKSLCLAFEGQEPCVFG
jgi:hypothetical protein